MYDYLNESFRNEESLQYILSIQVSLNGFSFCIRKANDNSLLVFKHTDLKISSEQLVTRRLEDWINEEELLQKTYKALEFIWMGPHFTLLPDNLEGEQIYSDTIRLLFPEQTEEYVVSKNEQLNARLLFLLPPELKRFLNDHFESFQIRHGIENLIRQNEKDAQEKQVRLLFDEKELYIIYFDRGQLKLCNAFSIKHANDAVYYILTALKQFKVTPKNIAAYLAGKSVFLNPVSEMLEKYFRSVNCFVPVANETSALDQKTISEYPCLF